MINEEDVKRKFGDTLRHFRLVKGYSQEELASKTGMHRTYVSDVERGDRNLSLVNIMKICEVLSIPTSHFFKHMEIGGTQDEA